MIRKYIIVADDSIKGFDEEIAKLEREWGAEEIEPCEDCISRKEALRHGRLIYDDDGKGYVVVRVDEIIDLPSITPSKPKGKWIHWTDDYKDYVTCSCCGYGEEGEVLLSDKTPFCPICGADMRGETE
jgi:hypothetical protein